MNFRYLQARSTAAHCEPSRSHPQHSPAAKANLRIEEREMLSKGEGKYRSSSGIEYRQVESNVSEDTGSDHHYAAPVTEVFPPSGR
jgi:hypothetical protein